MCQGLIRDSRTIASKGDLGHGEHMGEKYSPTPFIRLSLGADLYGAGSVAVRCKLTAATEADNGNSGEL